MDRYSRPAKVEELLPRWRSYSAYLIESGGAEALDESRRAERTGVCPSSGLAAWMQKFVGQEIFPVCLDWLGREGVSVVPASHGADALMLSQSVQSCFFFSEDPSCEPLLSHETPPDGLTGFFTNFHKRWRILARPLRRFVKRQPGTFPSPMVAQSQAPNGAYVKNLLRHNSDVILIWCLANLARGDTAPAAAAAKSGAPADEPNAVLEAIAALAQTLGRATVDAQELQDVAHELVQRFRDHGYESKLVEEGAPYHETMRAHFDVFGHIEPGQPVKTVKAALLKNGMTSSKGTIRRLRPSQGDKL